LARGDRNGPWTRLDAHTFASYGLPSVRGYNRVTGIGSVVRALYDSRELTEEEGGARSRDARRTSRAKTVWRC
jgi:hypothetical protein